MSKTTNKFAPEVQRAERRLFEHPSRLGAQLPRVRVVTQSDPKPLAGEASPHDIRNHAGGAAPASGLNFQAVVTAIAAVHLIDGSKIGWLDELADDTPTAIWAESGGPGDDVRLELQTATAELQAKRGLSANATLWEAMLDIARGLNGGRIDFGVLAVSPDSSRTVRHFLEQNLRHVGSGRTDRLHEVGRKWIAQLDEAGLDPVAISRAIRIQTVAATDGNVDAIRAAKSILTRLCGSAQMADLAWQTLVEGAHALIARKGRWDLLAVVRLLSAANVSLGGTNAPGTSIAKVIDWAKVSNQTFTVFGAGRPVSLDAAWISLSARSTDLAATPVDPAAAMARYRGIAVSTRRAAVRNAKISTTPNFSAGSNAEVSSWLVRASANPLCCVARRNDTPMRAIRSSESSYGELQQALPLGRLSKPRSCVRALRDRASTRTG